jgi:hypothetical protein
LGGRNGARGRFLGCNSPDECRSVRAGQERVGTHPVSASVFPCPADRASFCPSRETTPSSRSCTKRSSMWSASASTLICTWPLPAPVRQLIPLARRQWRSATSVTECPVAPAQQLRHDYPRNARGQRNGDHSVCQYYVVRYCCAALIRMRAGRQRQYEVAALANLCLSTTDEAKTLIPTLNSRFEDEDDASLQQILEQIQNGAP